MHHKGVSLERSLLSAFKDNTPNVGLFFFKFVPKVSKDEGAREGAKEQYLRQFINERSNPNTQYIRHRMRILEKYSDFTVEMHNTTRFLCGVGYAGILDWGLSFDWTTGLPYLPGSSFKGVLLSFLEFCAGKRNGDEFKDSPTPVEKWTDWMESKIEYEEDGSVKIDWWTKDEIVRVFGYQSNGNDSAGSEGIGQAAFLDVYPVEFNGFDIDVITPHFTKYYENSMKYPANPMKYPPADVYSPVPTFFLAIKPGSNYRFCIKILNSNGVDPDKIKRLIIETGNNYGFGAKTSSGYGFFGRIKDDE
ncbi:MAG: type III-B CRISPR module RAMP protein Cmr6 [Candidatus Hatepunaea meridiana]|nr:type III-B CRISPR module RAMP protein Cmr6 [Candidatus Hatepunaea meridiana]